MALDKQRQELPVEVVAEVKRQLQVIVDETAAGVTMRLQVANQRAESAAAALQKAVRYAALVTFLPIFAGSLAVAGIVFWFAQSSVDDLRTEKAALEKSLAALRAKGAATCEGDDRIKRPCVRIDATQPEYFATGKGGVRHVYRVILTGR
uniref:hypothetical protein n=1 Tax=Cupriavidus taiwanensis TaxID=164546 RepID=UPI0011C06C56|nr:hypothetical protein [Cupriavidus taiwanensis]